MEIILVPLFITAKPREVVLAQMRALLQPSFHSLTKAIYVDYVLIISNPSQKNVVNVYP